MKDAQARKEIESLHDAVKQFGRKVGIGIDFWPHSSAWVRKEAWLHHEQVRQAAGLRKIGELAEKLDALVEALDLEFERRPEKLIAKKKVKMGG